MSGSGENNRLPVGSIWVKWRWRVTVWCMRNIAGSYSKIKMKNIHFDLARLLSRVMDGIFRNSSDYKGWPKTDMELTIRLLNCFFCFPLGLHLFLCSYKQSRMKSCSEASHHQQNCCLHCNSCFDRSCWTQICWKLLQGETPCCCWSTSSKGQWLNWIAK